MFDKMQLQAVIQRNSKEIQGVENKTWVIEVTGATSQKSFSFPVGRIVKHISKPLYKAVDTVNPGRNHDANMVCDSYHKALSMLAPTFDKVCEDNALEICKALTGVNLEFKGMKIAIDEINPSVVVFEFDVNGAVQRVAPLVFAKNWLIGNIKEV